MIDAVLDYAKVPVMIQSYSKAQSDAKTTVTPSNPKNTRRRAANSSTAVEVTGLNTNHDGIFALDGKFYTPKAFIPEEIYLGKISKVFWDARREKKMGISLKMEKKNRNWRDNYDCITQKAAANKADTKS